MVTLPGDESTQLQRLKHLTEVALPARAHDLRWPIRLDHCFKRICFDTAFEDAWFRHLPRPAQAHLKGEPLRRALQCAEELAEGDLPLLNRRNRDSLRWRGKLKGGDQET